MLGRSVQLDPRLHAVRSDLADVRLAERVFAPHYAEAMPRRVARAAPLLAAPSDSAEAMTALAPGDRLEILDIAGRHAWGIAVATGLVGYVALDAVADADQ